MDGITLLLSPSIINLENPASTANSIALQQASNSASSLVLTFGPLVDIEAITSPLSFLIIALQPNLSKPRKIAASKFNLYSDCEGGCQTSPLSCCLVKTDRLFQACLNSSTNFYALLFRLLRSFNLPPCTTQFL